MQFSLSWLHDFVDLGGIFRLKKSRSGNFEGFVDQGPARQLGDRLTSAGFAIESYPIAMVGAGHSEPEQAIDVEVTSNRPDAMCHLGLARELAVALEVPLRRPEISFYESRSSDGRSGKVVLEDPESCPRYVARIIRGVRVRETPAWLARRLQTLDPEYKPINNVVDATNYVLWELGQPLHAFDLGKLPGGEVRVRRARAGERLTTLDGVERELDAEILVIADRRRAVALAGVMGGWETRITEATTDVLLESAHFERRRIRAAARRLGLRTDASHRFERGADFGACDEASRRCAELIVKCAGGEVGEAIDAIAATPHAVRWELDGEVLARFAGCVVGEAEIERILDGLGFAPRRAGARRWQGEIPSWRAIDFEPRRGSSPPRAHAQDLFEEVLRHVGFERIPSTLPTLGGADAGASPEHERGRRVRDRLAGMGFAEAIHYAFHDRRWDAEFPAPVGGAGALEIANPLSERLAVLRRSLVPNLVAAAELNARRGAVGVALFELGHLFAAGVDDEPEAVALVWGGAAGGPWDGLPEPDLLALKGAAEVLLDELGAAATSRAAELPGIVPGTGAEWRGADGALLGWFGSVGRAEAPFPLHVAELVLDRIPAAGADPPAVEPPPRLPGVTADLTLTHALALPWAELDAAIAERRHAILAGWRIKERYRGAGVPAGAVATTITFDYHGGERSLTQDEVNALHRELARELESRFGLAREEGA